MMKNYAETQLTPNIMNMINNVFKGLAFLFLTSLLSIHSIAQEMPEKNLDELVQKTMIAFNVPGISLGIIKDGKVIHQKGYGLRSINSKQPVDNQTAFAIASNSKVFTAFALGMMMDEGKLTWDSKVTDFIPEFKMYDPYVTSEFTIRDLLTHRSGLGLGAGDLMFWPDSANFNTEEVIHNLRYLKPVSSFRTKFDYDNLLYIVAGEVLKRASGLTWEDFIEQKIMAPLNMTNSAASLSRMKSKDNVIDAHVPLDGKLITIARFLSETTNAAGGINSSIEDMNKWVTMLLNKGKYGSNLEKQLISENRLREIMTLQTVIPGTGPYNAHFRGYGLGLFLSDQNGYFVAEHTGGLGGMVTQVTMIPELKLGIIVLTNQQSGNAFTTITNQIKDFYFDIKNTDRLKELKEREQKFAGEADEVTDKVWAKIKSQKQKIDFSPYLGKYKDQWFGEIEIMERNGQLYFKSARSPQLQGKMYYYQGNTFVAAWNDRSMTADSYVMFNLDETGKANSIKMMAVSPATDFSYDFHDLDLKRK